LLLHLVPGTSQSERKITENVPCRSTGQATFKWFHETKNEASGSLEYTDTTDSGNWNCPENVRNSTKPCYTTIGDRKSDLVVIDNMTAPIVDRPPTEFTLYCGLRSFEEECATSRYIVKYVRGIFNEDVSTRCSQLQYRRFIFDHSIPDNGSADDSTDVYVDECFQQICPCHYCNA